jgi:predicted aconitase
VLLCNSLLGARGYPNGNEAASGASVCGRMPLYGKHDPARRLGTCLVDLDCGVETATDWDLLGYTLGKLLPASSVPVLRGDFIRPDIYKFKQFAAALAVESDIDMCHVVGLTPEAPTAEAAFGAGQVPAETPRYRVGLADLDRSRARVCDPRPGKVGYVSLGCPHYSIFEIQRTARFLEGRRVAPGTRLQIWTAYATRAVAERCGYARAIREAGGSLCAGHCPFGLLEYPTARDMLLGDEGGAAFDSIKMADGLPAMYDRPVRTYFGEPERCLLAATRGYWE